MKLKLLFIVCFVASYISPFVVHAEFLSGSPEEKIHQLFPLSFNQEELDHFREGRIVLRDNLLFSISEEDRFELNKAYPKSGFFKKKLNFAQYVVKTNEINLLKNNEMNLSEDFAKVKYVVNPVYSSDVKKPITFYINVEKIIDSYLPLYEIGGDCSNCSLIYVAQIDADFVEQTGCFIRITHTLINWILMLKHLEGEPIILENDIALKKNVGCGLLMNYIHKHFDEFVDITVDTVLSVEQAVKTTLSLQRKILTKLGINPAIIPQMHVVKSAHADLDLDEKTIRCLSFEDRIIHNDPSIIRLPLID